MDADHVNPAGPAASYADIGGDCDHDRAGREARRRFLRYVGAGSALLMTAPIVGDGGAVMATAPARGGRGGITGSEPAGAPDRLSGQEVDIILQVARTGAVYPVVFPDFGEPGPATARATELRLLRRLPEVGPARFTHIQKGAQDLISVGLLNASRNRLLDGLGRHVLLSGSKPAPGLVALVALAIAVISKRSDPNTNSMAALWLGAVRRRYARLRR